jgi:hypothetical protein
MNTSLPLSMSITTAEAGRRGGKSRAERLSPEKRSEIARLASLKRWKKFFAENPEKKERKQLKSLLDETIS